MLLRPLVRNGLSQNASLFVYHAAALSKISSTPYSTAAAAAVKGKARANDTGHENNIVAQLESEGSRVLRVVRSRMAERERLMKEIVCTQNDWSRSAFPTHLVRVHNQETESATGSSSAAHIQRAKLLKELEPLARSWDEWTQCLEVSCPCLHSFWFIAYLSRSITRFR